MNVVAFNGSARKNGNTAMMINYMFEELTKEGIETEMVQLCGEHPHGCIACYQCFKKKDGRCIVDVDCITRSVAKMLAAAGIVVASPTFIAAVSTEMKALIDRCGMVSRANGDMYKRKVGAAIVTQRRGGGIHAFDTMNHFFTIGQMIIVGSSYWNMGFGREKGEVANDAEAINVMRDLGRNMAWLLKKLKG